jgi:muramidase (phage lysozyme)
MNPGNRAAFLDMIAFSEGTSTHPITKNNGYDVIVTGLDRKPEIFTDYSDHPFAKGRRSKIINKKGLTSNASGRYQFMLRDWIHYRDLLGLQDKSKYPLGAFSPAAQDAWAIQLIRERKAIDFIDSGYFAAAVWRVKNIWASLPGANYGQRENPLEVLQAFYRDSGGTLA